jgi:hypothetical protein
LDKGGGSLPYFYEEVSFMKEMFLTPIHIPEPPPHTQIHPRCFTCKKFPVCNLREDYLKTAFLI